MTSRQKPATLSKHDMERGFASCWSGANAPPRKNEKALPRIKRKDVELLRKSIERRGVVYSGASKWEKGVVEYPEVPEAEEGREIVQVGDRVRELPKERQEMVLHLISSLEHDTATEDTVNSALTHLIEQDTIPMWLDDKLLSPPKRGGDKIFSPVVSKRPTSGRRARTPAGYSSAPKNIEYSKPGVYTTPAQPQPLPFSKRPSYEDPLDTLVSTTAPQVRSAPTSRPVSPSPSPSPLASSHSATPPLTPNADFCIPTLPSGRYLTINCLTTWGDPHYIGLNGIEVYDGNGAFLQMHKEDVTGTPHSINVLPEYTDDPRVVQNLVDGVCRTCDDRHVWLAPFTSNTDHTVRIDLGKVTSIAMMRFWNYNKSRPHSCRGVKDLEVKLDDKHIFKGEISQASGMLKGAEDCTEIVLFTMDQCIMGVIDQQIREQALMWDNEENERGIDMSPEAIQRPTTSHGGQRPATTAGIPRGQGKPKAMDPILADLMGYPTGVVVTLEVLRGWGDMLHAGLGCVQLIGTDDTALEVADITCSHPCEDTSLLLSPDTPEWFAKHDMRYSTAEPVTLTITLKDKVTIKHIQVWNYNEGLATTFRGVKRVRVSLDGKKLSQAKGAYVRKAPGHKGYDYSQKLAISENPDDLPATMHSSTMNKEIADAILRAKAASMPYPRAVLDQIGFEPPMFPTAYVFRFELQSTHGDQYYVGFDGMKLWDVRSEEIPLVGENLQAIPRDITVLKQCSSDTRVLSNLADGVCGDENHSWLAPFSSGFVNVLYIVFEEPVAVSRITFWNYSKTPARGVDQLTVYADDNFIYSGRLKPHAPGRKPQHMIFTPDPSVLNFDIVKSTPTEANSGVVFYDSGKVSDLDSMPQTSCGSRPATVTNVKPLRPAGFHAA